MAENQVTAERVFLDWVKWRIRYNVNVSQTSDGVLATGQTLFEKVSEGKGQGPYNPTFIPITSNEE